MRREVLTSRWVTNQSSRMPIMRLIGKAPHNVLSFTEQQLIDALERNGLRVECVERHGVKGTDVRPFIVARAATP